MVRARRIRVTRSRSDLRSPRTSGECCGAPLSRRLRRDSEEHSLNVRARPSSGLGPGVPGFSRSTRPRSRPSAIKAFQLSRLRLSWALRTHPASRPPVDREGGRKSPGFSGLRAVLSADTFGLGLGRVDGARDPGARIRRGNPRGCVECPFYARATVMGLTTGLGFPVLSWRI